MTSASTQLDAEVQWLAFRKTIYPTISQRIEALLHSPKLANLLSLLEESIQTRQRVLLSPYVFQILQSVEMRGGIVNDMPVLGRRPAEVRAYLQTASKKSRLLAKQLRKLPQPTIALAGRTDPYNFLLFSPVIEAPEKATKFVPLSDLLIQAAETLDLMATRIAPADQRRRPAKDEGASKRQAIRQLAMKILIQAFREELGRPYHSHVAAVTTELSGIETASDDVKKVDKRLKKTGRNLGT